MFLHHEFFHVYHRQYFKSEDKIWSSLWSEGLATYVSEVLNPGSSLQDLKLDIPSGLVRACEDDINFLWSDLETLLDSSDEIAYEKYFLFSSNDIRVPKRAGYYLGYLIAKDLAQTYSLSTLVKMNANQLRSLIGETISSHTKKHKIRPSFILKK